MSLKDILHKIQELKPVIEQDLNGVSKAAIPYKEGKIRSAKEKLEYLKDDYRDEVLRSSIFMLVTGNELEEFASTSEKNFNCFSVKASLLYEEIVAQLHPSLYLNKGLSANVFDIANRVLEDKMKQLNVASYPMLLFDKTFNVQVDSEESLVKLFGRAINEKIGGDIVAYDAALRVSQQAIQQEYTGSVVPIVLYSKDSDLITQLQESFTSAGIKNVTINIGSEENAKSSIKIEDASKEQVESALTQVKQMV